MARGLVGGEVVGELLEAAGVVVEGAEEAEVEWVVDQAVTRIVGLGIGVMPYRRLDGRDHQGRILLESRDWGVGVDIIRRDLLFVRVGGRSLCRGRGDGCEDAV